MLAEGSRAISACRSNRTATVMAARLGRMAASRATAIAREARGSVLITRLSGGLFCFNTCAAIFICRASSSSCMPATARASQLSWGEI